MALVFLSHDYLVIRLGFTGAIYFLISWGVYPQFGYTRKTCCPSDSDGFSASGNRCCNSDEVLLGDTWCCPVGTTEFSVATGCCTPDRIKTYFDDILVCCDEGMMAYCTLHDSEGKCIAGSCITGNCAGNNVSCFNSENWHLDASKDQYSSVLYALSKVFNNVQYLGVWRASNYFSDNDCYAFIIGLNNAQVFSRFRHFYSQYAVSGRALCK